MAANLPASRVVPIHPWRPQWERVRVAAAAIRRGEVIAIPTDTVYGLAGDPFRPSVVEQIFRIKRRREDQPILLLIASLSQVHDLAQNVPRIFRFIAAQFWPGPLTVILPASDRVPASITSGRGTVALRWPRAPIVQSLVRAAGVPVTGTSANLSGRPAAVTAEEVKRQVGTGVSYIVNAGRAPTRRPSTILDLTGKPRIVRQGVVPAARLASYLR